MTVRIAFSSNTATFTQRGKNTKRGFIRVNGRTVTGEVEIVGSEQVFYSEGRNSNAAYGDR